MFSRKIRREDELLNLGVDGIITLKLILKKRDGRCGMDSSGSGYGTVRVLVKAVINILIP
jgi:hypothetical protein